MAGVVEDPELPGHVTTVSASVAEVVIGDWKFERLDDGTFFVTQWRAGRMVSHTLFSADEAASIKKVIGK